jgi:hypothetical protein
MKYVIYAGGIDMYLKDIRLINGHSFTVNIHKAKQFSKYNIMRFYYKWYVDRYYTGVRFKKIVRLTANFSNNL